MKAEKGDLIRITNAVSLTYGNGDIFEVIKRGGAYNHGVYVENPGGQTFIYDKEYVIHRKAGEEDDDVDFDNSYAAQYERMVEEESDEVSACASCGAEIVGGNAWATYDTKYDATDEQIRAIIELEVSDAQLTQANRIRATCSELADLLVRKNHDYGDSFAQQYAKYGLMSALIRMDDKMRRLETLQAGEQAQVSESVNDTLLDLAGYALLTYVEQSKK